MATGFDPVDPSAVPPLESVIAPADCAEHRGEARSMLKFSVVPASTAVTPVT